MFTYVKGKKMNENKTLLLIKPDAMQKKIIGKIISILEQNNINIIQIKILKLTQLQAQAFYNDHKNKKFYSELIEFMTSYNITALILQTDNINTIQCVRTLIGDTNYTKAKENTIRYKFATSLTKNTVHASDSITSYIKENDIIFNDKY